MQAVIEHTEQQTSATAVPTLERPSHPAGTNGRPGTTARHEQGSDRTEDPSFGHEVLVSLPATLIAVFVASTVSILAMTDDLLAAAGFGAYLAFWLGGGFGFLIAGIRWGLKVEAADHGGHRAAGS